MALETPIECIGSSIGELAPSAVSLFAISFPLIPVRPGTQRCRIVFLSVSLFSASLQYMGGQRL